MFVKKAAPFGTAFINTIIINFQDTVTNNPEPVPAEALY